MRETKKILDVRWYTPLTQPSAILGVATLIFEVTAAISLLTRKLSDSTVLWLCVVMGVVPLAALAAVGALFRRLRTDQMMPSGPEMLIRNDWQISRSVLEVSKPREIQGPAIPEELIVRAIEVLGSRDEAMRWLGTPVRALNLATPISILGSKEGVERVNDVLGQMEHGIW
jgi:hypothetical protein